MIAIQSRSSLVSFLAATVGLTGFFFYFFFIHVMIHCLLKSMQK